MFRIGKLEVLPKPFILVAVLVRKTINAVEYLPISSDT